MPSNSRRSVTIGGKPRSTPRPASAPTTTHTTRAISQAHLPRVLVSIFFSFRGLDCGKRRSYLLTLFSFGGYAGCWGFYLTRENNHKLRTQGNKAVNSKRRPSKPCE